MLKISLDYIYFEDEGLKEEYILDRMETNIGHYDPRIFSAFKKTLSQESEHYQILLINISEGMVLAEDIKTYRDQLIARSGQYVTDSLIQIIRHCLQNKAVGGKVKIKKTNK
jgi:HD-GYP domain-containing protein (c-di-GMP phosphodiesterase class II)